MIESTSTYATFNPVEALVSDLASTWGCDLLQDANDKAATAAIATELKMFFFIF